MRISGVLNVLLAAAAAIVLSACGADASSESDTSNLPPIISGTPPTKLFAGTSYSFQPSAADPNGDSISFKAQNLPTWLSLDANSGLVTGAPQEANVGMSGMITISATDGKSETDLPAFQIEVVSTQAPPATVNVAPTIAGTPSTQATVGKAYTFTPVGDDDDGDPLTYSIVNKPSWATFTAATGMLSGSPASGNVGTTSGIVISVSDGQQHTTSLAAFSITVATAAPTNRAPTITGTPGTSVTAGKAYSFQPVGSDPDGNTLTYSIQGKPTWLNFSTTTGKLSGTPTAANLGSSRMTITVSDGTLSASLPAFTLQVVAAANLPPIITGVATTTATVGQAYSFQPTASDPEGATLTFSITNKPSWASFNTTTGKLSGTPAAADVGTATGIVIGVSDGSAIASLSAFTIQVIQTATGSATLTWVAPTANTDDSPLSNLAGYRITYGRTQGALDQSIDITNPGLTTYVVPNLNSGTWYFAMYAYSSAGAESDASNVAQKTIP
jgi:hypothetical protein